MKFGYHRKLKDVVVIKPSCMTHKDAMDFSRLINRPVLYLEDFKGITGYNLEEIKAIIKSLETHSPTP